jgi:hypothetical protein
VWATGRRCATPPMRRPRSGRRASETALGMHVLCAATHSLTSFVVEGHNSSEARSCSLLRPLRTT